MKVSRKKFWLLLSFLLLIFAVGHFAWPNLLSFMIKNKIIVIIKKLKADGIEIRYDSLSATPDKIVFEKLFVVIHSNDNNACVKIDSIAKIDELQITGMKIFPLLLHQSLKLDSVYAKHPHITNYTIKKNKERKVKLKSFQLTRSLSIKALYIFLIAVNVIQAHQLHLTDKCQNCH